jgi:hypothetical protein
LHNNWVQVTLSACAPSTPDPHVILVNLGRRITLHFYIY